MMWRSNTLPALSSSRQMMMAWKVSGLSHSPAIIASRPASMRLAMAISPSRESSSTEPISRRYMRTGSSVRSVGLLLLGLLRAGLLPFLLLGLLGLDDVDAHLVEHRQRVLDLLGVDLLGRHHRVELLIGDIAALLGALDHLADGGIRKVEQRAVRGLGGFLLRRLVLGLLRLRLGGGALIGSGALRLHCHVSILRRGLASHDQNLKNSSRFLQVRPELLPCPMEGPPQCRSRAARLAGFPTRPGTLLRPYPMGVPRWGSESVPAVPVLLPRPATRVPIDSQKGQRRDERRPPVPIGSESQVRSKSRRAP